MNNLKSKVLSDILNEYTSRISNGIDPEDADFFERVSFAKKYGYSEDTLISCLEELNADGYIIMDITVNFTKK